MTTPQPQQEKENHLGQKRPAKPAQAMWKGFVQGSVGAAIGGACAHPLDLIKVRMQLQTDATNKLNMVQMGRRIFATEGAVGLFKGVDASIARQLVYSGTRFGMYDVFKRAAGEDSGPLSLPTKAACAIGAGAIGAFCGNPGDLAMVRMQADGKLPEAQRRGYRNIFDAVRKIAGSEGVVSLWQTGVVPNMNRAAIITVGQLAAYDQCKQILLDNGFRDGIPTHFGASFMAAFIASLMSNPVDVAKTRLMNQGSGPDATKYTGTLNAMTTMCRTEGPLSLYKGFAATFSRQCPYVVITWVSVEQMKKMMN
mmetsp:Transcript_127035/g.253893  ORF Transcript_127035/g.253893 Transcript_127035/m.253893 type:complete len:310 (+) Transcript_127035:59-988(+)